MSLTIKVGVFSALFQNVELAGGRLVIVASLTFRPSFNAAAETGEPAHESPSDARQHQVIASDWPRTP